MMYTVIIELPDDPTITYQIDADSLDQLMGRVKYQLGIDWSFQERLDLVPETPNPFEEFDVIDDVPQRIQHFDNVWRAVLHDQYRGLCMLTIVKTAEE